MYRDLLVTESIQGEAVRGAMPLARGGTLHPCHN